MSYEEARAKIIKHNEMSRRIEAAGFVYCCGLIFTGDSFNRETRTWSIKSQRIGELVWENNEWVVKPYDGFANLLEQFCGSIEGGEGIET